MFHSLSHTVRTTMPLVAPPSFIPGQPLRKSLLRPTDNGTFVLPLKQSFIKDARIMPGTMRMLALLTGWVGKGDKPTIETTQGIIGKHLNKSVRQIYRYLQDAMEEGYLLYSYTKNRRGMITGLRIWLNRLAIRRSPGQKKSKIRKNQDQTLMADTNSKSSLKRKEDKELWKKLESFAKSTGFNLPPDPTN